MGNCNERAILEEWVIMPNHVHCIITLKNWCGIVGRTSPSRKQG